MKKVYVLVLLNVLFINFQLQAQNFAWAKREGLWAYDYGYGVTTDNAGNVYMAGKYEMQAIFSGTTVPCQGNHDIYLACYSPSGTLNWIRTAGGSLGDYAEGVSTDGSNYVYIAGEIEGYNEQVTFVGTNTTLTSIGANDIFLAKYDLNGNLQWAQHAGGVYNEKALSVTNDNSGNVYICGFFNTSATFGNVTVTGTGGNDIFVAKYDPSGNFLWVKTASSTGRDEAKSVKVDASGNVYITGIFSGSCDFGTQTLVAPNGYYDMFLAKYSTTGTLLWVKQAGGSYDDVGWSLVLDNTGKIFVSGEFNGYATFDSYPLVVDGANADAYVACYDANGNAQWATKVGCSLIARARGIGTDGTNIFITGQYGGTATFDTYTISAADSSDIFIAEMNNSGNFLWAVTVGGNADSTETLGYESGNTICADANGNVYAAGSILDDAVFGNTTLTTYDRTDAFLTRITYTPTGIADPMATSGIHAYPNPSSGHIDLDLGDLSGAQLTVYNCLGQPVEVKRELVGPLTHIDLSAEGKGVYLLELNTGDKLLYRERLIIQ